MATAFDNTSHVNGSISVGAGNNLIFGTESFWTMTSATTVVTLAGSNNFRSSGQIYADLIAVGSSDGFNRVEIFAAGIVASGGSSAIALGGDGNTVFNAGQISGDFAAVQFSGVFNIVTNTGTILAEDNAIDFGAGAGSDRVTNSGTIVAHTDDAIQFDGSGAHVVDNSGTIHAPLSSAILVLGSGASLSLTNSGTIAGTDALSLADGADTVLNTGTISGRSFLSGGDDLFDTSRGIVNGEVDAGSGDDTLLGGAARDLFDGGSGDDLLVGNDGDDVLSGGLGADELDGGAGRDIASYAEFFGITVDLANPGANTTGAIGDSYISIENLTGTGGNDVLSGDAARNVLRGGIGTDVLDGRGGVDRLIGGAGDDQYVVNDSRDQVVERATEGVDLVRSSASYVLPADVENLTLIGTGAVSATGNSISNFVTGNNAANTLNGLIGNDSLTGGGGSDIFRFDTVLDAAINVDTINDFAVDVDKIQLSRAIFTEVNGGAALAPTRFFIGGAAGDAADRIIYNATTGELFYDADGAGAIAQVLFARIGAGLALDPADFVLVG